MADMFRKLNADEIEVRVKQVSEKGAVALLYKTARTDMQLLDETVGAESWSCDYKEIKGNLFCGITVKGVTKWDCGIESREDDEGNEKKGEASDAFKRAGFRWGIGRELYTSPFIFLSVPTEKDGNGKWIVSNHAKFSVGSSEYEKNRISKLVIVDDKSGKAVYSFPRGGKPSFDEEPREETPESVAAESEKMRKIILDLGKSVGRDEPATRMFAEAYIEKATGTFVAWDEMTIDHLASAKVALANRIKDEKKK